MLFNERIDEALDYRESHEEEFIVPESILLYSSVADPLQLYLNEIHKFPTLSHKETVGIINKVISGDMDAREYLINCHLKFAFTVALKYVRTGFPIIDLVQQANIGLMTAVDRYSPNRGTKFSTYAFFWIRFSILSYIKENLKFVRLPNSVLEDMSKIKRATEKFYSEHYCTPGDIELSTLTGLSVARVKFIRTLDFEMLSTDEKISENENDHTLLDILADSESDKPISDVYTSECRRLLNGFICKLSDRERNILRLRYGIDDDDAEMRTRTLEEVGNILGISRERVRQIENLALEKIRHMPGITSMYHFLK